MATYLSNEAAGRRHGDRRHAQRNRHAGQPDAAHQHHLCGVHAALHGGDRGAGRSRSPGATRTCSPPTRAAGRTRARRYDGYDYGDRRHLQSSMLVYSIDPNIAHPSHPDYAGATVAGVGEDAIGGGGGEDAVYADEEFEDEEEDAAEAAREASWDKPRGRPAGSKNKRHK